MANTLSLTVGMNQVPVYAFQGDRESGVQVWLTPALGDIVAMAVLWEAREPHNEDYLEEVGGTVLSCLEFLGSKDIDVCVRDFYSAAK